MLNKSHLNEIWDHLRLCHGITLRVIEALPENKIGSQLIPHMRTPSELVFHMYSDILKSIQEGIVRGEIAQEGDEKKFAAGVKSRAELLKFARDCWTAADKATQQISDKHLEATVKTPWGMDFPGHFAVGVTNTEFLHHRGQLYAFLRASGGEPPMMWDFENNVPEFRPKAKAKA